MALAVTADQLRHYGGQALGRCRLMASYGAAQYRANRVFKYLTWSATGLVGVVALGQVLNMGGTTGSSPAPPPIIVGPNGATSGGAAWQFGSPQQGPDLASEQRQRVFVGIYDGLRTEPRAGFRCDKLAAAVQALTTQDRAQLLPQAVAPVADADVCRANLDLSDARFTELSRAAAAWQAEETPKTAQALSRAVQAMIGFDHSREIADQNQSAFDLGQAAATALQESDQRLKDFAAAAGGADAAAPLDAQARLVAAAQALTGFDLPRLTTHARNTAYARATGLAEQFEASDRRIGAALRAADPVLRGGSDADGAGLIDAVGALLPLDLDRASPPDKEALARARGAAHDAAVAMLATIPPQTDAPASSVDDERAARIRRAIGPVDAAALSPEQRQALDLADRAVARIAASDARIVALGAALDAWRKSPSPFASGQVVTAYKAITDYDRARFTAGQQAIYLQVEAAYYGIAGKTLGLNHATKALLPIFVVNRDGQGRAGEVLLETLVTALGRDGYHVIGARSGAAMVLEISARPDGQGIVSTSAASLDTARADATLHATWQADGSEFVRLPAKANGSGGTAEQAMIASFRNAAELLEERFRRFVETGERP